MNLRFVCSHCWSFQQTDDPAGTIGTCPECGARGRVENVHLDTDEDEVRIEAPVANRFVCPLCWHFFDSDEAAGTKMKCPECHAIGEVARQQNKG